LITNASPAGSDDARQQRAGILADSNHAWLTIFHGGDEAVGGAEVYAKNSGHLFQY